MMSTIRVGCRGTGLRSDEMMHYDSDYDFFLDEGYCNTAHVLMNFWRYLSSCRRNSQMSACAMRLYEQSRNHADFI